jgi:hypothetical protein
MSIICRSRLDNVFVSLLPINSFFPKINFPSKHKSDAAFLAHAVFLAPLSWNVNHYYSAWSGKLRHGDGLASQTRKLVAALRPSVLQRLFGGVNVRAPEMWEAVLAA